MGDQIDDLDDEVDNTWIGPIVKRANMPQLTDLGGATHIHNHLTCSDYSERTYRRFPVRYVFIGRERRYCVDDVIAYAKQCLEQAPRRIPPERAKRVRPATIQIQPVAVHRREVVGQQEISEEGVV